MYVLFDVESDGSHYLLISFVIYNLQFVYKTNPISTQTLAEILIASTN